MPFREQPLAKKSPFLCQTPHEDTIPRRISIRAWLGTPFGVDPCDAFLVVSGIYF